MKFPDKNLSDARILVVDDQASNVLLLTQMLTEAGYTNLQSQQDPTQVCALHRAQDFDLILLDLQMPGMDGFQVIEGLKTSLVDAFLPVVVVTAQPGHKQRALQAGVRDFISKPFDLLEVKTRIRNVLEVRLLYRQLEASNRQLEALVLERTAELRESEARFRGLTELACDWYWEQNDLGEFTRISGPVIDMLGISVKGLDDSSAPERSTGWDEVQRTALQSRINARVPFLDFVFDRTNADGTKQEFIVSGEPMFDRSCNFLGYRGVGTEITLRR